MDWLCLDCDYMFTLNDGSCPCCGGDNYVNVGEDAWDNINTEGTFSSDTDDFGDIYEDDY